MSDELDLAERQLHELLHIARERHAKEIRPIIDEIVRIRAMRTPRQTIMLVPPDESDKSVQRAAVEEAADQAIEDASRLCERFHARGMNAMECASAIRAMRSKP